MEILPDGSTRIHFVDTPVRRPDPGPSPGPLVHHDGRGNTYGVLDAQGNPISHGNDDVLDPAVYAAAGQHYFSMHLGTGARSPITRPTHLYSTTETEIKRYQAQYYAQSVVRDALRSGVRLHATEQLVDPTRGEIVRPAIMSYWLPAPAGNAMQVEHFLTLAGKAALGPDDVIERNVPLVQPPAELAQRPPQDLSNVIGHRRREIVVEQPPINPIPTYPVGTFAPNSGQFGFLVHAQDRRPLIVTDVRTGQPYGRNDSTFGGNPRDPFDPYLRDSPLRLRDAWTGTDHPLPPHGSPLVMVAQLSDVRAHLHGVTVRKELDRAEASPRERRATDPPGGFRYELDDVRRVSLLKTLAQLQVPVFGPDGKTPDGPAIA
jgi:hypothetical protein